MQTLTSLHSSIINRGIQTLVQIGSTERMLSSEHEKNLAFKRSEGAIWRLEQQRRHWGHLAFQVKADTFLHVPGGHYKALIFHP